MYFFFALITSLSWGGADLFYKKGSKKDEKYTHLKIVVMVGLVMGIFSLLYYAYNAIFNDYIITFNAFSVVKYLPVSFFYIVSMIFGYIGLRYLMLSLSAPIQNSSGAICFFLFLIIYPEIPDKLTVLGVVLTIVGVIYLGIIEKKSNEKDMLQSLNDSGKGENTEKYKNTFIALIFPLLYAFLDSIGTFLDGIYLDDDAADIRFSISGISDWMGEDEAFMAYSITFFICAVFCFIFVKFIKKEPYIIPHEKDRATAAVLETLGQFFYIFSMAENSVIAAPLVATYCIFSAIFSRIVLKEKLTFSQLRAIIIVIIGIAIIGIAEAILYQNSAV